MTTNQTLLYCLMPQHYIRHHSETIREPNLPVQVEHHTFLFADAKMLLRIRDNKPLTLAEMIDEFNQREDSKEEHEKAYAQSQLQHTPPVLSHAKTSATCLLAQARQPIGFIRIQQVGTTPLIPSPHLIHYFPLRPDESISDAPAVLSRRPSITRSAQAFSFLSPVARQQAIQQFIHANL